MQTAVDSLSGAATVLAMVANETNEGSKQMIDYTDTDALAPAVLAILKRNKRGGKFAGMKDSTIVKRLGWHHDFSLPRDERSCTYEQQESCRRAVTKLSHRRIKRISQNRTYDTLYCYRSDDDLNDVDARIDAARALVKGFMGALAGRDDVTITRKNWKRTARFSDGVVVKLDVHTGRRSEYYGCSNLRASSTMVCCGREVTVRNPEAMAAAVDKLHEIGLLVRSLGAVDGVEL